MQPTNATAKKTAESTDSKPATIIIERNEDEDIVVNAAHHIINDSKVLIYIDDRRNGVDLTEALANCHICRSQAGLRAHRGDAKNDDSEDSESDFTVNDGEEIDIDLFGDGDPEDRIDQTDALDVMPPGIALTAGEIAAMIDSNHAKPGGIRAILDVISSEEPGLVTRHERDDRDDLWELIETTDTDDEDGIIVGTLTGEQEGEA